MNPEEEAALIAKAVAAQTHHEEQTPEESLAEFKNLLDSGWYGQPDEIDRDLARLRRSLGEED